MGSESMAEPVLPDSRPASVGSWSWAAARVAARPGVRYGALLVAMAAGLVGSAALLGHAVNAPSLYAYQREPACGIGGAPPPDCRMLLPASVLSDRPFPLGIHQVTLSADGRTVVYLGRATQVSDGSAPRSSADALVVGWRGRAARVMGAGLVLDPFEGPPGSAFLLIAVAVLSELLCALALTLQGLARRLRARALPAVGGTEGAARPPWQAIFLGARAVALLAGQTGHWSVAAPLHAACGAVTATLLGIGGVASGRSLLRLRRRGVDSLSDERALRLGADVTLSAALVALCLSVGVDLVVADVLALPR